MTRPARALRLSLAVAHGALLAAVVAIPLAYALHPLSAAVAVAAAVPLIAAIPGLRAGRRYTYQWLSPVMVLFAGLASVEVVASSGRAIVAVAVLLLALAELAAALALIRRAGARAPVERTEC